MKTDFLQDLITVSRLPISRLPISSTPDKYDTTKVRISGTLDKLGSAKQLQLFSVPVAKSSGKGGIFEKKFVISRLKKFVAKSKASKHKNLEE